MKGRKERKWKAGGKDEWMDGIDGKNCPHANILLSQA